MAAWKVLRLCSTRKLALLQHYLICRIRKEICDGRVIFDSVQEIPASAVTDLSLLTNIT